MQADPSVIAEWLVASSNDFRELQLVALENLCNEILFSNNTDVFFSSYPREKFVPRLCDIFFDEMAPDTVLEANARALTYLCDMNTDASRYVHDDGGILEAIIARLDAVDMSSPKGNELGQQLIKLLLQITQHRSYPGCLTSVLRFIRLYQHVLHVDVLDAGLELIRESIADVDLEDTNLPYWVESLCSLFDSSNTGVADGALHAFGRLVHLFSRSAKDLNPLTESYILDPLLRRLRIAGGVERSNKKVDVNTNADLNSPPTGENIRATVDGDRNIVCIITSILTSMCQSSTSLIHRLIASDDQFITTLIMIVQSSTDNVVVMRVLRLIETLLGLLYSTNPINSHIRQSHGLSKNQSTNIIAQSNANFSQVELKGAETTVSTTSILDQVQGVTPTTSSSPQSASITESITEDKSNSPATKSSWETDAVHHRFIEAIKHQDLEFIKNSLKSGQINCNYIDHLGQSLLNWAASFGSPAIVELLCTHGANVHLGVRNSLDYAAIFGRAEICRSLINWGADVHKRDAQGKRPIDRAREHPQFVGSQQVIDLLESEGRRISTKSDQKSTTSPPCSSTSKHMEEDTLNESAGALSLSNDPLESKPDSPTTQLDSTIDVVELQHIFVNRLLPFIVKLFDDNTSSEIRHDCIQIIRCITCLIYSEHLREVSSITVKSLPLSFQLIHMMCKILMEERELYVLRALEISQYLVQKCPEIYTPIFHRLGVTLLIGTLVHILHRLFPNDTHNSRMEQNKPIESGMKLINVNKKDNWVLPMECASIFNSQLYSWEEWSVFFAGRLLSIFNKYALITIKLKSTNLCDIDDDGLHIVFIGGKTHSSHQIPIELYPNQSPRMRPDLRIHMLRMHGHLMDLNYDGVYSCLFPENAHSETSGKTPRQCTQHNRAYNDGDAADDDDGDDDDDECEADNNPGGCVDCGAQEKSTNSTKSKTDSSSKRPQSLKTNYHPLKIHLNNSRRFARRLGLQDRLINLKKRSNVGGDGDGDGDDDDDNNNNNNDNSSKPMSTDPNDRYLFDFSRRLLRQSSSPARVYIKSTASKSCINKQQSGFVNNIDSIGVNCHNGGDASQSRSFGPLDICSMKYADSNYLLIKLKSKIEHPKFQEILIFTGSTSYGFRRVCIQSLGKAQNTTETNILTPTCNDDRIGAGIAGGVAPPFTTTDTTLHNTSAVTGDSMPDTNATKAKSVKRVRKSVTQKRKHTHSPTSSSRAPANLSSRRRYSAGFIDLLVELDNNLNNTPPEMSIPEIFDFDPLIYSDSQLNLADLCDNICGTSIDAINGTQHGDCISQSERLELDRIFHSFFPNKLANETYNSGVLDCSIHSLSEDSQSHIVTQRLNLIRRQTLVLSKSLLTLLSHESCNVLTPLQSASSDNAPTKLLPAQSMRGLVSEIWSLHNLNKQQKDSTGMRTEILTKLDEIFVNLSIILQNDEQHLTTYEFTSSGLIQALLLCLSIANAGKWEIGSQMHSHAALLWYLQQRRQCFLRSFFSSLAPNSFNNLIKQLIKSLELMEQLPLNVYSALEWTRSCITPDEVGSIANNSELAQEGDNSSQLCDNSGGIVLLPLHCINSIIQAHKPIFGSNNNILRLKDRQSFKNCINPYQLFQSCCFVNNYFDDLDAALMENCEIKLLLTKLPATRIGDDGGETGTGDASADWPVLTDWSGKQLVASLLISVGQLRHFMWKITTKQWYDRPCTSMNYWIQAQSVLNSNRAYLHFPNPSFGSSSFESFGGVIDWLATNGNCLTLEDWINPAVVGLISIATSTKIPFKGRPSSVFAPQAGSLVGSHSIRGIGYGLLLKRRRGSNINNSDNDDDDDEGVDNNKTPHHMLEPWIAFDLGMNLLPTAYALAYLRHTTYVKANLALRNWRLEASNDATNWIVLRDHINDDAIQPVSGSCNVWNLDTDALSNDDNSVKGWRYFKIQLTGPNAGSNRTLALGGIEFYGNVYAVHKNVLSAGELVHRLYGNRSKRERIVMAKKLKLSAAIDCVKKVDLSAVTTATTTTTATSDDDDEGQDDEAVEQPNKQTDNIKSESSDDNTEGVCKKEEQCGDAVQTQLDSQNAVFNLKKQVTRGLDKLLNSHKLPLPLLQLLRRISVQDDYSKIDRNSRKICMAISKDDSSIASVCTTPKFSSIDLNVTSFDDSYANVNNLPIAQIHTPSFSYDNLNLVEPEAMEFADTVEAIIQKNTESEQLNANTSELPIKHTIRKPEDLLADMVPKTDDDDDDDEAGARGAGLNKVMNDHAANDNNDIVADTHDSSNTVSQTPNLTSHTDTSATDVLFEDEVHEVIHCDTNSDTNKTTDPLVPFGVMRLEKPGNSMFTFSPSTIKTKSTKMNKFGSYKRKPKAKTGTVTNTKSKLSNIFELYPWEEIVDALSLPSGLITAFDPEPDATNAHSTTFYPLSRPPITDDAIGVKLMNIEEKPKLALFLGVKFGLEYSELKLPSNNNHITLFSYIRELHKQIQQQLNENNVAYKRANFCLSFYLNYKLDTECDAEADSLQTTKSFDSKSVFHTNYGNSLLTSYDLHLTPCSYQSLKSDLNTIKLITQDEVLEKRTTTPAIIDNEQITIEDTLQLLRTLHQLSTSDYARNLNIINQCVDPLESNSNRPIEEFVSHQLTKKLLHQINDARTLASGVFPDWCMNLTRCLKFMFTYEARSKLFDTSAFGPAKAVVWLQNEHAINSSSDQCGTNSWPVNNSHFTTASLISALLQDDQIDLSNSTTNDTAVSGNTTSSTASGSCFYKSIKQKLSITESDVNQIRNVDLSSLDLILQAYGVNLSGDESMTTVMEYVDSLLAQSNLLPNNNRRRSKRKSTSSQIGRLHKEFVRIPRLPHELVKCIDDQLLNRTQLPSNIYGSKLWHWASRLMLERGYSKSKLEIQFTGEAGTGLGPTLEFYSLLAAELRLRDRQMWVVDNLINYDTSTPTDLATMNLDTVNSVTYELPGRERDVYVNASCGLFPMPWYGDNIPLEVLQSFYILGITVAKCLQDNRRIDLPLSLPLLKLLSSYGCATRVNHNRQRANAINATNDKDFDQMRKFAILSDVEGTLPTPPPLTNKSTNSSCHHHRQCEQSLLDWCAFVMSPEYQLWHNAIDDNNLHAYDNSALDSLEANTTTMHWLTGVLNITDFFTIYPTRKRFFLDIIKFCCAKSQLTDAKQLTQLEIEIFGCTIEDLCINMEFLLETNQSNQSSYALQDYYNWESTSMLTTNMNSYHFDAPMNNDSVINSSQQESACTTPEPVTAHNIDRYFNLTLSFCLDKAIRKQMDAFKDGFERVFPMHWLSVFYPEELGQRIAGDSVAQWTKEDLFSYTVPCFGFTKQSATYQMLINVLHNFNLNERRSFLQFITGCSSLPPGGLRNLHPPIRVVRKDTADSGLYPSVNTCVHYLKLPEYKSEDELRYHLLGATKEIGFYLN